MVGWSYQEQTEKILSFSDLWRLRGLFDFAVVVLVDQFPQLNIELLHAVGRDEDLESGNNIATMV